MIRNSLRFTSYKDRKQLVKDLRMIYTAATEEAAQAGLETFAGIWDSRYPQISQSWRPTRTVRLPGPRAYARAMGLAAQVRAWLAEDLGDGDRTTAAVISADARCSASLLLNDPGVVSGLMVCQAVFEELDPGMSFEARCADGDRLQPCELARLEGAAAAIMAGERLALNLLGRLSGIATLTRRYVDAVAGTGATILDTRKTTPGLRALEKDAVRHGGGSNHRMGLYDGILIKENHLRLAGGIRTAVQQARLTGSAVEVECETLDEMAEALAAGAERILLDNMPPKRLAEAVALVRGRAELEASGGINLDTVRTVAQTGVEFISIGALTHTARSLDVSLEVLA